MGKAVSVIFDKIRYIHLSISSNRSINEEISLTNMNNVLK